MNKRKFQIEVQKAFCSKLPSWNQWRGKAIYRLNDGFVQWLHFETSEFRVVIRPQFSIQALATKFPALSLTIGEEIRDSNGMEWWITPDNWVNQNAKIIDYVLEHVKPSPHKPLTYDKILNFLESMESNHPALLTAKGIVYIQLGNLSEGQYFLNQAKDKYSRISTDWAFQEEARINRWLQSSQTILGILQSDALEGEQLLNLR